MLPCQLWDTLGGWEWDRAGWWQMSDGAGRWVGDGADPQRWLDH